METSSYIRYASPIDFIISITEYALGVPHKIEVEDEYKGYRIPSGSIVIFNEKYAERISSSDSLLILNFRAMMYDEKAYPNPTIFNPERFLKDGKLDPEVLDPRIIAFGFGRRVW